MALIAKLHEMESILEHFNNVTLTNGENKVCRDAPLTCAHIHFPCNIISTSHYQPHPLPRADNNFSCWTLTESLGNERNKSYRACQFIAPSSV